MILEFYNKLSAEEKKVFFLAITAVVIAFFDGLFLRPVLSKMKAMDIEIMEKASGIRTDARYLSYEKKIREEDKAYRVFAVDEAKTEEEIIAVFLKTIELLASESRINISKLSPAGFEEKKGFILYFASLECSGKLDDMVIFLHKIDTTANLLRVAKYNMTGKKASAQDVTAVLKVAKLIIDPKTIGNYTYEDQRFLKEIEETHVTTNEAVQKDVEAKAGEEKEGESPEKSPSGADAKAGETKQGEKKVAGPASETAVERKTGGDDDKGGEAGAGGSADGAGGSGGNEQKGPGDPSAEDKGNGSSGGGNQGGNESGRGGPDRKLGADSSAPGGGAGAGGDGKEKNGQGSGSGGGGSGQDTEKSEKASGSGGGGDGGSGKEKSERGKGESGPGGTASDSGKEQGGKKGEPGGMAGGGQGTSGQERQDKKSGESATGGGGGGDGEDEDERQGSMFSERDEGGGAGGGAGQAGAAGQKQQAPRGGAGQGQQSGASGQNAGEAADGEVMDGQPGEEVRVLGSGDDNGLPSSGGPQGAGKGGKNNKEEKPSKQETKKKDKKDLNAAQKEMEKLETQKRVRIEDLETLWNKFWGKTFKKKPGTPSPAVKESPRPAASQPKVTKSGSRGAKQVKQEEEEEKEGNLWSRMLKKRGVQRPVVDDEEEEE